MPQGRETVSFPIFPVHGVLFPGMHLSIRVSHDRFLRGFESLVRLDSTLAVALIRHPREGVGTAREPHLIGTTARIVDVDPVSPDLDRIEFVGISRIHLLSYRQNGPHLLGQARYLPDLQETVPAPLLEEACALGSELWSVLPLLDEPVEPRQRVPREAEAVSYWIGQHLPVEPAERQELLELRTTGARLSKEVGHMRTILDALRSEHKSS